MKLVTAGFTFILLLGKSLVADAAPFQQQPSMDYIARENVPVINASVVKDAAASYTLRDNAIAEERDTSYNRINTRIKAAMIKLKQKAIEAEAYVVSNNFNDEYCFLLDMSIPSGKRRFFVYNMKTDSVEYTSLVSHGSGSYRPNCDDKLIFSNTANSYCTSLGRYKIGASYYGTYGLSYKLFGMDSTNSNAYARAIVLHSDKYVPEKEAYPYHIYESAGCPIVSPAFLNILSEKYIRTSKKPVLLWVYN